MNEDIKPKIRPLEDKDRLILAGTSKTFHDLLRERPDNVFFCAHAGPSMNPTLCDLDLLEVEPYRDRQIRIGDVVVFVSCSETQPVVHRVVHIVPSGYCTRGDNNNNDDPQLLKHSDIAGRVVAAHRGKKRRKIAGGWAGRLTAYSIRWCRALDQNTSKLLHPIYISLAKNGTARRLLPARFKPRVVISQVGGQSYLRLLMGKRIVGKYDACQHQWSIRRPFRLFVDETVLPGNVRDSREATSIT